MYVPVSGAHAEAGSGAWAASGSGAGRCWPLLLCQTAAQFPYPALGGRAGGHLAAEGLLMGSTPVVQLPIELPYFKEQLLQGTPSGLGCPFQVRERLQYRIDHMEGLLCHLQGKDPGPHAPVEPTAIGPAELPHGLQVRAFGGELHHHVPPLDRDGRRRVALDRLDRPRPPG